MLTRVRLPELDLNVTPFHLIVVLAVFVVGGVLAVVRFLVVVEAEILS